MKGWNMTVLLRSGERRVRVEADSAVGALRKARTMFPGALKFEHSTADHRGK